MSWIDKLNAYNPFNLPGVAYTYATGTREWLVNRRVRTVGDFWAMAEWALKAAQKEKPSFSAIYAGPLKDVKLHFPATQTIPALFQRLVSWLGTAPRTKSAAQQIAKEYWLNVEQGGAKPTVAPASTPTFAPSDPTTFQPAVTPEQSATTLKDRMFAMPWYVPIIGAGIGVVFLAMTRGKK